MSENRLLFHHNIGELPAEGGSLARHARRGDYKIDPQTGCWNWQKYVNAAGYGQCSPSSFGALTAHRAYFRAAYGELPEGAHVHHKCENPRCVNPAHLEAKLPVAHLTDHQQGNSHLTWETVREIRRRYVEDCAGVYELGEEFGLGKSQIHNIVTNRKWVDPGYTPGRLIECALVGCEEVVIATRRQQRFCSSYCRDKHNNRIAARRKSGIPLDALVRTWTRRIAA